MGHELCFKEIRTAVLGTVKGDVVELFGLTEGGKVFRYQWEREEWTPLSMWMFVK